VISALNSSKTAYASFSLVKKDFFVQYNFNATQAKKQQSREEIEARFTCQLYNKVGLQQIICLFYFIDVFQALLSIFKGQLRDLREKDTAIERCECYIQDQPDKTECRFVVKMVCRHGIDKSRSLPLM